MFVVQNYLQIVVPSFHPTDSILIVTYACIVPIVQIHLKVTVIDSTLSLKPKKVAELNFIYFDQIAVWLDLLDCLPSVYGNLKLTLRLLQLLQLLRIPQIGETSTASVKLFPCTETLKIRFQFILHPVAVNLTTSLALRSFLVLQEKFPYFSNVKAEPLTTVPVTVILPGTVRSFNGLKSLHAVPSPKAEKIKREKRKITFKQKFIEIYNRCRITDCLKLWKLLIRVLIPKQKYHCQQCFKMRNHKYVSIILTKNIDQQKNQSIFMLGQTIYLFQYQSLSTHSENQMGNDCTNTCQQLQKNYRHTYKISNLENDSAPVQQQTATFQTRTKISQTYFSQKVEHIKKIQIPSQLQFSSRLGCVSSNLNAASKQKYQILDEFLNVPKRKHQDQESFEQSQKYQSTERQDCKIKHRIQFESGVIYEGEFIGGKRQGYGLQKWPDGAFYQGQWKDNKANGKGKFTHPDGDYYDGQWSNNKAQGRGIYERINGGKYEGQWLNDQPHGFGVQQWGDGNIYEGLFQYGYKQGKGKYKWNDGSQYEGEWNQGKIQGKGKYKHYDGRVYDGSWKRNMMDGHGVYIWKDGRKYIGQYKEDKKHGIGKYFWDDGRVFEGQWKDGKRNGKGKIFYPDGTQKSGIWENDKRVEQKPFEQLDQNTARITQNQTSKNSNKISNKKTKQSIKTYSNIHTTPKKRTQRNENRAFY